MNQSNRGDRSEEGMRKTWTKNEETRGRTGSGLQRERPGLREREAGPQGERGWASEREQPGLRERERPGLRERERLASGRERLGLRERAAGP